MALDGIFVRALKNELSEVLTDARINKIAQPEPEELLLTLRTSAGLRKLLISGSASLPFVFLTEENKQSPLNAPGFLMLLRKYLNSARILSVTQPGFERVICFSIEHLDEMGDLRRKTLCVELMGKYSNIILVDEEDIIVDAIRRVPPTVSSVRTVLPGQPYFIPDTQGKKDASLLTEETFLLGLSENETLCDSIFRHYTGFSLPLITEFSEAYGLRSDRTVSELSGEEKDHFAACFMDFLKKIRNGDLVPEMAKDRNGLPAAFSAIPLLSYRKLRDRYQVETYDSPSRLLSDYYSGRNVAVNMRQRSQDMRKITETLLDRACKKRDLQLKQLKDTEKKDSCRLYGELLQAYSYSLPVGRDSVCVQNYYTGEEVRIPTDPDLSIADCARGYFDKYAKLKRTAAALSEQLPKTEEEIAHLQSILLSIDQARDLDTLKDIRTEMTDWNMIRSHTKEKKAGRSGSRPYHYRSSDGFDIYVGKNNLQNDYLTFHLAENSDIFFHAKKTPGSHVILKTGGREVPDRTYEEAGALAAYYSTARENPKAEIDYVERKQVKKPAGACPGFVVYYTNYSLIASPDISGLTLVER